MEASLFQGLVYVLIFHPCKSEAAMLAEQKITGFVLTAQGVVDVTDGTHTEMEGSQPGGAEEKGDTHQPPRSQGTAVTASHEESDVMRAETGTESNASSEIIASEDPLLKLEQTSGSSEEESPDTQTLPVLDETTDSHEFVEAESDVTDFESWRIGAISAVASLVLVVVIVIYCLKFRKRTIRQAVAVKDTEDSEAAETINGESKENTLTGADGQINQNVSNESLDRIVSRQDEHPSDISLDLATEAASSLDLSEDVRSSML